MEVLLGDPSSKSIDNQKIGLLVSARSTAYLQAKIWSVSGAKKIFCNEGLEKKNTKKKVEVIVRGDIEYVQKHHVKKKFCKMLSIYYDDIE